VLHAGHDRAVRAMRDALGEESFATAWAAGRALPLEEAVTLALEEIDALRHQPEAGPDSSGWVSQARML
jgi:hypothetical protein